MCTPSADATDTRVLTEVLATPRSSMDGERPVRALMSFKVIPWRRRVARTLVPIIRTSSEVSAVAVMPYPSSHWTG